MLKLELTDGKSTIYAMEYSSISALHVNLRPGTKIRLIGPIKCVNHILFLESRNVEVLGGEVDTLLIINAFENMLLKSLNKPINPNPTAEYAGISNSGTSVTTTTTMEANVTLNGNTSFNGMRTIDTYMTPTRSNQNRNNVEIPVEPDPFEDSEIFAQVDLEQITAQTTITNAATKNVVPSSTAFDDDFDDLDALAQIEEQILAQQQFATNRKRPSSSPVASPSSNFVYCEPPLEDHSNIVQASKVPKLEGLDDFDEIEMIQESALLVEFHAKEYKFRLEGCNLLTIDQFKCISSENLQNQTFMFFAETKKVTKPLHITAEGWTLEVEIEDTPESTLNVALDPVLLETLIGYSAQEVKLMRQKAKTQPALKEEIIEILKKFNDSIKSERRFWKIRFSEASTPQAISTTNLKPVYKRIMMNKIDAEKLESFKGTVPP